MAPRFARHLSAAAPRILTAAAFAVVTAALVTPPTAQAQRHAGSVSVDLSVLDSLGTPQNVPQMLRPGVRSLLMPNVRQNGSRRFAPATPAAPRASAAPVSTGLALKPPTQMKRPMVARPAPVRAAQPKPLSRPAAPRITPPAAPVIAAKPPAAPKVPAAPAIQQRASAPPLPVSPPAAPSFKPGAPTRVAPPPPAPTLAPPPAPPAPLAARPTPKPAAQPTQTAALTSAPATGGKLAAGQQFRLMFGAGAAAVENAAGGQLDNIAKSLKADESLRLQLLAYSGGGAQTPSQARRMSLSRALAVRSRLIKEGVRSTRIDVRALGNKSEGGPPDRVDVIVTKR